MNLYAAEQEELLKQASSKAEMIVKEAQLQAQSIREQISQEKTAWEQEKAALVEQPGMKDFQKELLMEKNKAIRNTTIRFFLLKR